MDVPKPANTIQTRCFASLRTVELTNSQIIYMRKQIAAANWKMNLTVDKAIDLLDSILNQNIEPAPNGQVVFGCSISILQMANEKRNAKNGYAIAAQNCSNKKSGAYTGEVSVELLGLSSFDTAL